MPRYDLKPLDDRLAVGKTTLTSREIREELGISPSATANLLNRWSRAGFVDRVAQGRYAIRQIGLLGTRAASEDIALAVSAFAGERAHRIAYHSALDFHGLLVRPVRTVQIASPHHFTGVVISGRPLQVVFERLETVGVGAEPAGHGALASNLERTLLDAAARPDLVGGFHPLAEALAQAQANASRLVELADHLSAGPALRRIGSLVDCLDLRLAGKLEPLASPLWDLDLDPGLRDGHPPFRDGRWGIRWPIDPRNVAEEIER